MEKPDFELRGTVLFLMKEASYDYQLKPEEFPWFFDRPLLTKYLDYLYANRFNTIFLWSGNLFPSIVRVPDYPDATSSDARGNDPQSGAVRVVHARMRQAEHQRFAAFLFDPFAEGVGRFAEDSHALQQARRVRGEIHALHAWSVSCREFDSVGLYVCPGEVLNSKYTAQWIHDVIIPAAKASEKNPRIVVRYWGLDAEGFKKLCVPEYDNFYTELKHNVEMVVSPVPGRPPCVDVKVAKKHIVNLHEVADIKPFRWGSPRFIREMVGEWKKAGIDGAEVYGMMSWRWPYALDRLEPQQEGFWPHGQKAAYVRARRHLARSLRPISLESRSAAGRGRGLLEGEAGGEVRQSGSRRIASEVVRHHRSRSCRACRISPTCIT